MKSKKNSIDWNLPNVAAKWAKQYAGSTYHFFTQGQKKAIRDAIEKYYKMRLKMDEVEKLLLTDFNKETAERITCTEITRASANAAQIMGEQLQKELGKGMRVEKIWHTHNDDLVCRMCRELEGKKVAINASFTGDIFLPPAHIWCRCSITTSPDD